MRCPCAACCDSHVPFLEAGTVRLPAVVVAICKEGAESGVLTKENGQWMVNIRDHTLPIRTAAERVAQLHTDPRQTRDAFRMFMLPVAEVGLVPLCKFPMDTLHVVTDRRVKGVCGPCTATQREAKLHAIAKKNALVQERFGIVLKRSSDGAEGAGAPAPAAEAQAAPHRAWTPLNHPAHEWTRERLDHFFERDMRSRSVADEPALEMVERRVDPIFMPDGSLNKPAVYCCRWRHPDGTHVRTYHPAASLATNPSYRAKIAAFESELGADSD